MQRKTNDQLLIIAIYVDDGIIAGTNEQEIKEFLDELMFSFKITSEPLNYFLGIEIERQLDGSIFINQKAYIKRIIEKFNKSQANKVGTPTDNSTVPGEAEILENVPFREAIGSLMHLSCLTRPDITFALNKVSQKLAAPTKYDWEAVKRIFKYLVGTTEYGIMYQKGHKVGVLESFSDADFAGDPETRRSTSGVVCKLAGGAISWLSQKQISVSLSTTEAELVAASNTAKEVIWLNRLFSEISPLNEQPIIKVDNASTIKLIKNPEFHKRTKHIEIPPETDVIVGLEARGFLIGPILALRKSIAFVPLRKKGKLPGECISQKYGLEYGSDSIEIQKGSIKQNHNVVIVDDLLATGGTMEAAIKLVQALGGNVTRCLVVIELEDLRGREKLNSPFVSLIKY
ncbi:hypothetical protein LAZ67_16002545 [Cordylochernes scorpioides]|uniref:Adenine phosphoribosyltransferase n=1 Tax=Cordylochernes scorpioides TaxID=51811 RepID=A0ABY6LES7_9ARAC|nr:hypothetical protein LAZ67_16002545 [Cordylochernes scorpioides]